MSKKIVLSVNTDSTNEYEKLRLENLRKVDLWITAFSPVEEMAKTLKKKPMNMGTSSISFYHKRLKK